MFGLALASLLQSVMAFVGPLQVPYNYRPVGVYCDVCDTNLLVWRCYSCGGQYCGRCIFQHRDVPGLTLAEVDAGHASANEVSEGMHALWLRFYQRLSSMMASDPADAADLYSEPYLCR